MAVFAQKLGTGSTWFLVMEKIIKLVDGSIWEAIGSMFRKA